VPTRNVNLTDHDDHFVKSLIGSARCKNASEVMHAGLRLLEQAANGDEEKLSVLRSLASEAFAALDRGQGTLLEGDQQLGDFLRRIGLRAVRRAARGSGGK
jgi:antitoxin ParD1/3/4